MSVVYPLVTTVSAAKTAEPIDVSFGVWTEGAQATKYRWVHAGKETGGGGLTKKNRRGYKNSRLAAAYRCNRQLIAAYGGGWGLSGPSQSTCTARRFLNLLRIGDPKVADPQTSTRHHYRCPLQQVRCFTVGLCIACSWRPSTCCDTEMSRFTLKLLY